MDNNQSTTFIHPSALCESDKIGAGTRIWAFAHILDGAEIGRNCNICDHVFIESAVRIGSDVTVKNSVMLFDGVTVDDEVFLGPGMIFTNDLHPRIGYRTAPADYPRTHVARGASVGAGAVLLCGIEIGCKAFVGAGAVVIRDVPPRALMVGNPARQIGWVCDCGRRLDDGLHCTYCDRTIVLNAGAGERAPISEGNAR